MKYVCNSFSLQMLTGDCNLKVKEISEDEFNKVKGRINGDYYEQI